MEINICPSIVLSMYKANKNAGPRICERVTPFILHAQSLGKNFDDAFEWKRTTTKHLIGDYQIVRIFRDKLFRGLDTVLMCDNPQRCTDFRFALYCDEGVFFSTKKNERHKSENPEQLRMWMLQKLIEENVRIK